MHLLRLLALSTASVVGAAILPVVAVPAASADDAPVTAPRSAADAGIVVGETAVSSRSFVRLAQPSAQPSTQPSERHSPRPAKWPIGGGRATLTTHPVAPTGGPSQQFTRVQMAHYRAFGGVMEARIQLAAAPDPAVPSWLVLAWGRLNSTRTQCLSPAGSNIGFTATDTDTQDNPVYRGARIDVRAFEFPAARRATWNCAFAQSRSSAASDATLYDSVTGRAGLFRQKPLLSVRVKGRKLKRRGFTRVPVIIRNGQGTVATAPKVRLKVKTRGVAVRYNPRVGTIKPGGVRRGAIFVKDVRPGKGWVTLIVTSRNARVKLTLPVREGRR